MAQRNKRFFSELHRPEKDYKFIKGALCGALLVFMFMGLLSCALQPNGGRSRNGVIDSGSEKKLNLLKELVDQYYLGEVDEKALQEGIYAGYISGLGDPYSEYCDAETTEELAETIEGKYSGIGAVLTQDLSSGIITLTQIYEDSPAWKSGLREEDILYRVGEEEVTGQDLDDIVKEIKGEEGTELELTVMRGKDREEVTVTVVRDTIEYRTVEYKMLEDSFGYIRILQFDAATYEQYMRAYQDLRSQGMRGVVIDLRSNPGGSFSAVCEIVDEILPEGLIVYTEDKNGKRQETMSDAECTLDVPLVVLVNEYTASASEIFAGAVQDHAIGKIVGTQSYGKGVVQQIINLEDGTSLKLTVSEYFTPKGRSINEVGIVPDVEEEYERDEAGPEADNQLNRAISVLKEDE